MKSFNPSHRKYNARHLGALAIGASLLSFASNQASATLTFDLRATGVSNGAPTTSVVGPKSIAGLTVGSVVTFDVWAQITSATGGVMGFQNVTFSILSANGGSILGNMGQFTPLAPWDSASVAGVNTASLDADADFDLGSNATGTLTGLAKARSDNTAAGGGDPGFGTANPQTSAVHTAAANFVPVTNAAGTGFEILLGRVTFTMTGTTVADPNTPIGINARPGPTLLTGGTKATGAQFVESGDLKSGSTGVFAVGSDVALSIIPVPEPSAFGMVLLGAMGIVGLRRAGVRKA